MKKALFLSIILVLSIAACSPAAPFVIRTSTGTPSAFGPNPYNPFNGTNAQIYYWLDANADTGIYIIDLSGSVIWKQSYASGAAGGSAGANNIAWDGKDASGNILGNGVYLYKIIQGGRAIGGGKIAIIK